MYRKYRIAVFNFSRYQGYCPQLKYSIGKTYGQETGELAHVCMQKNINY